MENMKEEDNLKEKGRENKGKIEVKVKKNCKNSKNKANMCGCEVNISVGREGKKSILWIIPCYLGEKV